MAGFESVVPLLGRSIALQRDYRTAEAAAERQVRASERQAAFERQRLLLDQRQRAEDRARYLREAQATRRARSAAAGTGAGSSAAALLTGLAEDSVEAAARDRAEGELALWRIEERHRLNLLDASERQRRAALGLGSGITRGIIGY